MDPRGFTCVKVKHDFESEVSRGIGARRAYLCGAQL